MDQINRKPNDPSVEGGIPETPESGQETFKLGGFGYGNLFLLFSIIVFAVIIGVALARQGTSQPTEGMAPYFEITTFDGDTYTLDDFRGKVVMVNFWASWCVPCKDEAPELQAAWEHYQNRDDVVFLGIAYADNGPRSIEFIENYGITYLNAPDLGTRISDLYAIQGVPETFIIDQDGHVEKFIYAGVTKKQLVSIIDPLLGISSGGEG